MTYAFPPGTVNGPYGLLLRPTKDTSLGDYLSSQFLTPFALGLAPGQDGKVSLGDYLSSQFLTPFALGLAPGQDGKVYGFQWVTSLFPEFSALTLDLANDEYNVKTDKSQSLGSVEFEGEHLKMVSATANVYHNNSGKVVKVAYNSFTRIGSFRSLYEDLWRKSMFIYWELPPRVVSWELPPRVVSLTLRDSVIPRVGSVVAAYIPALPLPSGVVDSLVGPSGAAEKRLGRVIEVAYDMQSASSQVTIIFGRYLKFGDGAVWVLPRRLK